MYAGTLIDAPAARLRRDGRTASVGIRARVAACAGSAALYGALFPPFDLVWLAPVALAPYLWALAGLGPARAAMLGLLWATLATAAVAWWLPEMLAGYFGFGPLAALVGLVGVGLFTVGPFQAGFAAFVAWRTRAAPFPVLAVGAAFALAEYARSHAPVPNPVGLIAYGAVGTPFAQLADLAGPFGLGGFLAATAAAFAQLARPGTPARRLSGALGLAFALAVAAAYGGWRLAGPSGEGPPLRVAIVQGAVVRPAHWDRGLRAENLERYLELTRTAAATGPALVFWPEFAVDFYLQEASRHRTKLREGLAALGAPLVTGASHYEVRDEAVRYHNSVYLLDAKGATLGRYDKMRLMPFAEYGPLGDFLRSEIAVYEPGAGIRTLDAPAARIGAFLCGESLFPEVARELSRGGAELLANPSNDHWFGAAGGAEQHLRAARLRAIENRRFVVRPTATGFSAVIDPQGRIVAKSGFGSAEVVTAEVRRSRETTPVQRAGDAPLVLAGAVVLGSSMRRRSTPSSSTEGEAG